MNDDEKTGRPSWDMPGDPIADALRSLPLAEMPAGFTQSVLSQIEMVAPPRFRLPWLEIVLCAFLGVMLLLLYLVILWLPPGLSLFLRLEFLSWMVRLTTSPWAFLPSLAAAGAGFAGALAAGQLVARYWEQREKSY